jgi:hypothetical protein
MAEAAAIVTLAWTVTDMQAAWLTPQTTLPLSFTCTGASWKYDEAGQTIYISPRGTAAGKPCALL